ncbi:hypothetical protein [Burkholderia territorii]|uniref:hypothetical protein n=1 Tax=Burkholderia territorii TaxID=1503055 RepID=UPI0012D8934C|nr:hypothetical protein [Burkholderia territorii]
MDVTRVARGIYANYYCNKYRWPIIQAAHANDSNISPRAEFEQDLRKKEDIGNFFR